MSRTITVLLTSDAGPLRHGVLIYGKTVDLDKLASRMKAKIWGRRVAHRLDASSIAEDFVALLLADVKAKD